jgi:heptosyltransferase-2
MGETIAVRLPNWLGDTVMAVPALRALRAGFPDARLVLAGPWVSILARQGLADALVLYPRSWSGRLGSADAVRAFSPGTAVLMPNSLESAAAALYWGARRRVAFACGGRSALLSDRVPLPSPRRHQIDEYAALAERLGVEVTARVPSLAPPDAGSETREQARALLAEAGAGPGRGRVIGVHLGAAWGPAKLWPTDRVADFCRALVADGDTPLLLGAPVDAPLVARVLGAARAASLVGRDSPDLLPAVLAELDLLVSGDTGVAHLAAALGTPVVTVFGPTDPRLTAPRGAALVVRHAVPCSPCFYRRCPIEHPCMTGIAAGHVREAARALTLRA